MRKREIDKIKAILLERRAELIQGANQTRDELHQRRLVEEPEGDEVDLATDEIDQNLNLRIRGREGMLLSKIERALKQMDEGTYGICEKCGEEIDARRLMARPVATLCISCKQAEERRERTYGEP